MDLKFNEALQASLNLSLTGNKFEGGGGTVTFTPTHNHVASTVVAWI
jgi:hypothetical protein